MSKVQKGPWEIDKFGNIVDTDDEVIRLNGVSLPSGRNDADDPAHANKALVLQAPSLNHVVGKMLEIMADPYSNNDQRMDKIYILTEELRSAYVDGADYDE